MTTDLVTAVGIDRYPAALPSLTNARADAQAIADLLARDYGFQPWPPGAPVLTDGAAALAPLRDAIASALDSGADRWLFYFAGHGAVIDGIGYLVPADGRFRDQATYLPVPWLLDVCRASAVDQIAIVLDACYSGRALVRGETLDDFSPTADYTRVRQIVSAGNPRQPVLDGGAGGHSVFTQSLLDALEGRAGIHEPDGAVRFPRLLDHLAVDVPARLWAAGGSPGEQQPLGGYFQGNTLRRTFDLTPIAPRLPPALVQDTRSPDPTRRQDALRRLAGVAGEQPALTDPAVELGLRHLRPDPVTDVRAEAATALGALGNARAVVPLITALDDEPAVGRAAAHALGQLGDARAVQPILRRLRDPAREPAFLALTAALGALGDPAALTDALRESLRRGRLVPWIGPDLPASLTGLPARADVALGLSRAYDRPPADSLAQAAAQVMLHDRDRFSFTDYMRRALNDQLVTPRAVYQALARLDAPLWLSAAYDGQLARALGPVTPVVAGSDARYWRADRPTVVRVLGDLAANHDVVVLERDYEVLREQEGERRLLLGFLREQLAGRVVLFLGHDPASPDLALLERYVLNHHLADVDAQAFLVWPAAGPAHTWAGRPIYPLCQDPLALALEGALAPG